MHGWEGEEKNRRKHMRLVSDTTVAAAAAAVEISPGDSSISPVKDSSFYKDEGIASQSIWSNTTQQNGVAERKKRHLLEDGRKISVGDSALFQAGNSPPFIGIIRWLTSGKEGYLTLGVNWLYRPADVKLCKGNLLDAAPNEVFYSFHQDEIPAAALLHPCKVAFLCKGVELPSGISAFVCRRVYDISNKCLWWLTDQDYINERQEEVDQLLEKTRLEMHAAVQSGGRSPKPLNGPTSTHQLKTGPDSAQNSTASQGKGKKRERSDQGPELIKRERSSKVDDGDSGHFRLEGSIKAEISKITDEEEGLTNFEGVEKLVHLMKLDRAEKKMDLIGRIMLADVVAATENLDCLAHFVLLRGVPVLDDWLQEVHKGKIGNGSSPKECDKSVEELVLALLRALDKLPVNLLALQTCNVGKSVNHLRSHKNLEIQKKARSLVDTWKKRVEAEMKSNDAKSGPNQAISWQPGKPGYAEASHGGNRRAGSYDVAIKSSITQPSASKTGSVKLGHGDVAKPASSSPGSGKLTPSLPAPATTSSKDPHSKMAGGSGTSDIPPTTMKEEKSSSSSQSQNNNQSCSSDHAKTMASAWKEDARSSTSGSMSVNKASAVAPRMRKSNNVFMGSSMSGVQKETSLGKTSSLNRNATPDKLSESGLTCERALDVLPADHSNNHRLIVRLPNPTRSPARSVSGGSFEDPSVMGSRASSPGASEKHDNYVRKAKGKSDTCQTNIAGDVNTESWQSNDVKDGLAGLDEGDRSPAAVLDEECSRNGDDVKSVDVLKASCSSPGNSKGDLLAGPNSGKSFEASFSSMNALIESCAKYSEASASLSADDDLGMNLLASVAAGELSPGSSGRSFDDVAEGQPDVDLEKLRNNADLSHVKDEIQQISSHTVSTMSGDGKNLLHLSQHKHKSTGEQNGQLIASGVDLLQNVDECLKSDGNADETVADGCVAVLKDTKEEVSEGDRFNHVHEKRKTLVRGENINGVTDYKMKLRSSSSGENKLIDCAREKIAESNMTASDTIHVSVDDGCYVDIASSSKKSEKDAADEGSSRPGLEIDREKPNQAHEGLTESISIEQRPCPGDANHVDSDRNVEDGVAPSSCNAVLVDNLGGSGPEKLQSMEIKNHLESGGDYESTEQASLVPPALDDEVGANVVSLVVEHNDSDKVEETSVMKGVLEHAPSSCVPREESATGVVQETVQCMKSVGSKSSGIETDETEECVSTAEAFSANATGSDLAAKLDFDLNEGFAVDEGNQGEPIMSGSSSAVHLSSHLSFSITPLSGGLPVPITVTAAAKGPFVPPENLLRSKGELGWKGPADTSAFRKAEPRRVLEMPLNTTDGPSSDTTTGKQGRPPLEIDLNVPDERVIEDTASQSCERETWSGGPINNHDLKKRGMFGSSAPIYSAGCLDLDLNRVDEDTDNGQFSASTGRRFEVPLMPARPSSSSGFPNGEVNVLRDIDLNNGPGLDEAVVEPAFHNQHSKSSLPYLPNTAGPRMSNEELRSLSPWFPSGNPYGPVSIPSFLPDRERQPYSIIATAGAQRMLGSATGGTFGGDLYRGSVLSSPAMAFTPAAPFPYAGFPFGTSFPLSSTSFSEGSTTFMDSSGVGPYFPAVASQLVGPAGAVSSQYMRPYMSLPEGATTSGAESSQKWGRHGLDLNAGPGSTDMEGRVDKLPSASSQLLLANPLTYSEDQVRMYQTAGGLLKRKEPEGDASRFSYRQPSWQ